MLFSSAASHRASTTFRKRPLHFDCVQWSAASHVIDKGIESKRQVSLEQTRIAIFATFVVEHHILNFSNEDVTKYCRLSFHTIAIICIHILSSSHLLTEGLFAGELTRTQHTTHCTGLEICFRTDTCAVLGILGGGVWSA